MACYQIYLGSAEKPLSESINKNCILYYLCTHLNLFGTKSLHPDLNSKRGLNEKTSVVFFFLPQRPPSRRRERREIDDF